MGMSEKNAKFSDFFGKWKQKVANWIYAAKERRAGQVPDGEMTDISAGVKRHWTHGQKRAALIAGVAVLLIGAIVLYGKTHVYRHYRVLSSIGRADDATTHYVRMGNRLLKCNPNGVTCVNKAEEVLWNVTFTMQSPVVDLCGQMAVVGDQRGQSVYIFDQNGQVGRFEVEHTLQKVRVSEQGVVAAVLSDGDVTWIHVYDSNGTLLVRTKTTMAESGYPLDLDLSPNGQKMGVTYLTMDNRNIKTSVVFYNFSAVGQSEADYVVNREEYEGIVAPQICFLKGNYTVVMKDDGLVFFRGRQVPEKRSEIALEEEILSVFYSEEYIGVITRNEEPEQKHTYRMQIFRANGSKCGSCGFDMEYAGVEIDGAQILIHGDQKMEIYGIDGRKKASIEYEKQILGAIRLGGIRKYAIVTPDSTDQIRLR